MKTEMSVSDQFLVAVVILVLVLFGVLIGKAAHRHPEQVAMNYAKFNCEKDIPRSQNCVLEWKYVPEVKDEK